MLCSPVLRGFSLFRFSDGLHATCIDTLLENVVMNNRLDLRCEPLGALLGVPDKVETDFRIAITSQDDLQAWLAKLLKQNSEKPRKTGLKNKIMFDRSPAVNGGPEPLRGKPRKTGLKKGLFHDANCG